MNFDYEALDKAKTVKLKIADIESLVDSDFEKKLRKTLGLSQSLMASMLHVSTKTIEKWEEKKNPIVGGDAVALFLIADDPNLARKLIRFEGVNKKTPRRYAPLEECHDLNGQIIPFDLNTIELPTNQPFDDRSSANWKCEGAC